MKALVLHVNKQFNKNVYVKLRVKKTNVLK